MQRGEFGNQRKRLSPKNSVFQENSSAVKLKNGVDEIVFVEWDSWNNVGEMLLADHLFFFLEC